MMEKICKFYPNIVAKKNCENGACKLFINLSRNSVKTLKFYDKTNNLYANNYEERTSYSFLSNKKLNQAVNCVINKL